MIILKQRTQRRIALRPLLSLVLLLGLTLSGTSAAEPISSFGAIKSHFKFALAGAATTIALHELGHFGVASLESVEARFDGTTIVYPDQATLSQRQRLRLSTAGYQAQWLASEYAFRQLGKTLDITSGNSMSAASHPTTTPDKKAFHVGMVLGHIGISLAYLTALKGHDNGDSLGTANASTLSEDQVLLALALPAALDSWRLFAQHPPRWLPLLSKGSKAIGIAAVWSF